MIGIKWIYIVLMYVYFSLGTNLGDKEHSLRLAVRKIEEWMEKVISLSTFCTITPWGFSSKHTFLNTAICVETLLPPLLILHFIQEIEREMGHMHKSVGGIYGDRVIDIDLLLYGDQVLDAPELKLPHPLMHEHHFVLGPLAEIAPGLVHPVLKKKILGLLWGKIVSLFPCINNLAHIQMFNSHIIPFLFLLQFGGCR